MFKLDLFVSKFFFFLILCIYFAAYFGFTFVQPQNQLVDRAVTNKVNDESKIRENFHNLFSSIAKNDRKKSETYQGILKQEVAKEQQSFDTMKEELQMAQIRNAHKKKNNIIGNVIANKREIQENDRSSDGGGLNSIERSEIKCPYRDGGKTEKTAEFTDWEFYYNKDNDTDENSTDATVGAITFLEMETDSGPQTPPYNPEDMRSRDVSAEVDHEYLQSEWRQNWSRKNDDERFEEALQHANRPLLVNWYRHGIEQWNDLEVMKQHAANNNCEHSVLSEPIEVVELRLNKALKTIAKYIAKFDYGEATGKKFMS